MAKSVYEPSEPVITPVSVGIFLLPHRRATPSIYFAGIYTWVERCIVGEKCLAQEPCPRPGLEPGPLDQERAH